MILRDPAATVSADRARTEAFVEEVREIGEPGIRVWRPPAHVAFGRRDANRDGYDRAREIASERGYPVVERSVGGHAVVFTGTTVAFGLVEPIADARSGITERYDRLTGLVQEALSALGVDSERGEPEGAFCPGSHSLSAEGKLVGLAQRVHSDIAVTSGVLVVREREAVADVLAPVYEALEVPFRREAVGSLARAGGEASPELVVETLIEHLSDAALRET